METMGLVPIRVSTSQCSRLGVPASHGPCSITAMPLPGWSMVTLSNVIGEPMASMKALAKAELAKLL